MPDDAGLARGVRRKRSPRVAAIDDTPPWRSRATRTIAAQSGDRPTSAANSETYPLHSQSCCSLLQTLRLVAQPQRAPSALALSEVAGHSATVDPMLLDELGALLSSLNLRPLGTVWGTTTLAMPSMACGGRIDGPVRGRLSGRGIPDTAV